MGEPAAARREVLAQIIETQPGSESAARAHYELGGIQLARGNVEDATSAYRKVPPTWPRWHSRASLEIARIYDQHLQDVEAATREYRKIIRVHPDSFAAAEGYARMAEIHEVFGDAVSADNMRECAMRTYERLLERADESDDRDLIVNRYVAVARRLDRADEAIETLVKVRRQALRERDVTRRVELDRQLGLLYLDREQHGNALLRFRACLQHSRRRGDVLGFAALAEMASRCLHATGDTAGYRRLHATLLGLLARNPARRADMQRDPRWAPLIARAYVAVRKPGLARQMRTRLKRQKNVQAREALVAVEAELTALES